MAEVDVGAEPDGWVALDDGSVCARLVSVELDGVRTTNPTAPDDPREAAALDFVAWARGEGPAPDFADRVRLLQGGAPPFGSPTWLRDPTDRSLYSMCSGLPPGSCGIDPLYHLEHYEGIVVPSGGRALCRSGTADLPPRLAAAVTTDLLRLTMPEPPTCRRDLPVELWIADDGRIYAVNLASPPGT